MCSICFESFNKILNVKVTCPFCDLEACKTCVQTYLLLDSHEAHCMKCKHEFNREFIDTFCTKTFRNRDYRIHREKILYDREIARMPETQPHVTRELEIRSLKVSYVYLISLAAKMGSHPDFALGVQICLFNNFREASVDVMNNIYALRHDTPIITGTAYALAVKCPSVECHGFLIDDVTCGICKVTFCEKCHEVNDCVVGHECDPDTVKTIKLLKRDTKPCPKCNVPIHKIEGCAQMWCTQCYTAFDWRTGNVEMGRIHNPHYFEFKKRTREHGDIPCGGRPCYRELFETGASKEILDVAIELWRMERELLYKYGYIFEGNLRLRMKYMMNEMKIDIFKKELQRRDKYNCKMKDIQDIYRMFIDTVGDILRQYMLNMKNDDICMKEVSELTDYTNTVMSNIRARYDSKIPHLIIL
jgi:hypothetical protein